MGNKMKWHLINDKVLLRSNMKMATILKRIKASDQYLISFYDFENKLKYKIVEDVDIIDEKEYEIIKKRINTINKLLED